MENFEIQIQKLLNLNDKSTRRMDRLISDLTQKVGLEKQEILEFITYIALEEVQELEGNYDWIAFERKILKRIRAK